MLEELLRKEDVSAKKRKLQDEYGFIMSEQIEGSVNTMCNLSEVMIERGIKRGVLKTLISLICRKLQKKKTVEQIADEVEEDVELVEKIIVSIEKFAPEYNEDKILEDYMKNMAR